MEITLTKKTLALAAATATAVLDLDSLHQYDRLSVGIENPGANDVTAALWEEGVGDILADNGTVAAEVLDHLDAGEKSVVTLTGDDIPSRLKVTLTSSSGTSVNLVVKGNLKSADLFPSN